MEISTEKSKVMITTRNTDDDNEVGIEINNEELGNVKNFVYLGSNINNYVSSMKEVKKRIAIATSQLAKMNKVWQNKRIKMNTKTKLQNSLIKSTLLYACQSWTFNKTIEKRIEAFEMKMFRRLFNISWRDHVTNQAVRDRVKAEIGEYEPLLETARRRKLQFYGHISRADGTLAHHVLQGMSEGSRPRGRPRNNWQADINAWTGKSLQECGTIARNRAAWRKIVQKSKCLHGPRATR